VSPEPDVFAALADPTRRTVLEEVATRGTATATELAQPLGISRQAVAKHLGVLADAGLVDGRRAGRETRYRPTPAPMGEAISWMTEVGGRWDERLAALADPTRRTVLEQVATRGSATATELAAPLGISRQAVAKHLGVLADAGLVDGRRAGRETRYRPTPAPMGEAISWMTEIGGRWDERLAALERSVAQRRGARRPVSE